MAPPRRTARFLLLLAGLLVSAVTPLRAQSLMDRSPNLSGGWVGNSGQLYFNFAHRFVAAPEPTRKVTNFPTFTFAFGLPARTLIGAHYASNSLLAPAFPNEWEFFARNRPFAVAAGAPLDLAVQLGYNLASDGVDGEVSIGRAFGPVRPLLALRVLADPYEAGATQLAAAGGVVARLHRYVAVAGDAATIFDDDQRLAWSAGVHLALPYTPHTLSLHASNSNAGTLQGASRGERTRWGFEFTVPITPARWTAGEPVAEPAPAAPPEAVVQDTAYAAHDPMSIAPETARAARDTLGLARDTVAVRADSAAVPDRAPVTDSADAAPPAPARDTARAAAPRQPPAARPQADVPPVRRADIRGLAFVPARIEVARGTVVEWTNQDQVDHTVTARDGSFDSGMIRPGARWRYRFDRAGTYEIYCRPHPFMRLEVVVR